MEWLWRRLTYGRPVHAIVSTLPVVGIGIAMVVLVVAAAATWFPARKAATVDPALALKAE